MQRKRSFEPGDPVSTFTGQEGFVISRRLFAKAQNRLKEGRRPGHYFAPGCCHNPDYVTQVPILFEDGTFDVMRAMNIKKIAGLNDEKKEKIHRVIEDKLN